MADETNIPRFIVGMPRAGSTWLMRSLNQHPAIAAFGETCFWGRLYVEPNADLLYDQSQLAEVAASLKSARFDTVIGQQDTGWLRHINLEDLPEVIDRTIGNLAAPVSPGLVFRRFCEAIAGLEGKPNWVEKTPHHLNWVDRIVKWLPGARFIITIREPYGFMLSYKYQRGTVQEERQLFEQLYHPIACALVYRTYCRMAFRLSRELPEQVLMVRLEEIHREPDAVLDRVQDFFGLKRASDLVGIPEQVYSSFKTGKRPELSAGEKFWMNLLCGDEIMTLGYSVEYVAPRPWNIWNILKPALSFPFWGVRAICLMSERVKGNIFQYLWRWLFPSSRQSEITKNLTNTKPVRKPWSC